MYASKAKKRETKEGAKEWKMKKGQERGRGKGKRKAPNRTWGVRREFERDTEDLASQVIWCYCRLRVAWTGAHIYDAGHTWLNCD
jgi:hypothetical protein